MAALETGPLIAPVTALAFVGDSSLLAGIGPNVHVYMVGRRQLIQVKDVLHGCNIHGIKLGPTDPDGHTQLCVFGGKCLRVLKLYENNWQLEPSGFQVELDDWIWDVCWLAGETGLTDPPLAVALAHNSVLKLDWPHNRQISIVHCEEKCILYTATFIGTTWDTLILAAGTVFNEVVLWPMTGDCSEQGRVKVTHRLAGHQGVIFSIAFNLSTRKLCSVSDDRSIRLWQVVSDARDSCRQMANHWHNVKFNLVHVLYGHAARVWKARLTTDHIVSVGEDATCCIWNYDGQIIQKVKGHKGKSIWSLAVDEKQGLLATGGGDCSIRVWSMAECKNDVNQAAQMCRLPAVTPLKKEDTVAADDFPRSIKLLGLHRILVMTNEGSLYQYDDRQRSWTRLMHDPRYRSYSLMSVSPCGHVITLASIDGYLKLLQSDGRLLVEERVCSGKIFSVVWPSSIPDVYKQLIVTGPDGSMGMWQVEHNEESREWSLTQLHQWYLPPHKQRWITSAALLHQTQVLVCGDRGGTVHVYSLSSQEPVQSFPKIHGKSGVTAVCVHNEEVYTAGRDGQYRLYATTQHGLQLLHANKVLKGLEWIADLLFLGEDLVVLGFHTDQFIVYSVNSNQVLVSVPCGGGHRAWDFDLDPESGSGRFAFIKSKDVLMSDCVINLGHTTLQPCLHGRELTDLKHLLTYETEHGQCHIVATCSEDTLIQIVSLTSHSQCNVSTMEILQTLQGHISSVRTLAVIASNACPQNQGTVSKLLFSAGGRAQLKCWRIHLSQDRDSGRSTAGTGISETESVIHNRNPCRNIGAEVSVNKEPDLEDSSFTNVDCKTQVDTLSKCHPESEAFPSVPTSTSGIEGLDHCKHKQAISDSSGAVNVIPDQNSKFCSSSKPAGGSTCSCSFEHLANHTLGHKVKRHGKPWKKAQYTPDPETRFMSLTTFATQEVIQGAASYLYVVGAACSDSFIRVFLFNEAEREFYLLGSSDYHQHCVLTVTHTIIHAANQQQAYIFSGGTDGKVTIWNVTDLVVGCMMQAESCDLGQPCHVVPMHQSGVNSLRVHQLGTGGRCVVVTGGDDGALGVAVMLLPVDQATQVLIPQTTCEVTAHAAQVTGVAILDDETLISTSIDQRVCTWQLSYQPDLKLKQLLCSYVSVADIAAMDAWSARAGTQFAVCGVGLQLLQSSLPTQR